MKMHENKRGRFGKTRGSVLVTLLLALSAGGGWYLHDQLGQAAVPDNPMTDVNSATGSNPSANPSVGSAPGAKPRDHFLVAPGKVEAVDGLLELAMDMPGVLRKVHVQEGQRVQAGTVLAELINDEAQARLEVATREWELAKAKQEMAENGSRREEIDEARARVNLFLASLAHHERTAARREELYRKKAIAEEEMLDYQLRAEEARKGREAAAARLALLVAGNRDEEKVMARAATASAAARMREMAAVLERTRLKAPCDGTVLRVLRHAGESVMGLESLPIVRLADTSRLQLRVEVDESQITRVAVNQEVEFDAWGIPNRVYRGKLTRVADLMGRKHIAHDDPRERVDTRVLEVIITPIESDGLRLHQRVDLRIPVTAPANTVSPFPATP